MLAPQNLYDQYEPNDSSDLATMISTRETLKASLLDEKDLDWFQFEVLRDKNFLVRFENFSSRLEPYIYVYDHLQGEILRKENSTPGGHLEFQFKPKTTGIYFLQVTGRYGTKHDEKYSLLLKQE